MIFDNFYTDKLQNKVVIQLLASGLRRLFYNITYFDVPTQQRLSELSFFSPNRMSKPTIILGSGSYEWETQFSRVD